MFSSVNRDRLTAFLMLLPSIILIAVFVYGFIGQTVYSSMTNWAGLEESPEMDFVGLENYNTLFTATRDMLFRQELVNTFFFTLFFLLGCLGMGLFLAILIDQNIRGETFFRLVFLFPMSLSFIVTGTAWRWIFQPRGGINVLPSLIGLEPLSFKWITDRTQIWQFNWQDLPKIVIVLVFDVLFILAVRYWVNERRRAAAYAGLGGLVILNWFLLGGAEAIITVSTPQMHGFNLALVGIILAAVWQMSGYTMAMYLAGLRGVPEELREAARVDGASELQIYRHIILPILQPITLSAVIVLGHISLKIFDLIVAMAGMDYAPTSVPGISMYQTSFRENQFAKGAAIAVVMLVMVAVVIVPYLVTTLRTEHEL